MRWEYHDGGRQAAGFKGETGDCVVRAIAIALELDYRHVYDSLYEISGKTPRRGVMRKHYHEFIVGQGWEWTPTMTIGSGCRVHMRSDELPGGRLIVRLSKHISAVVDGIVYDIYDPSRDGTRCVYGYWNEG